MNCRKAERWLLTSFDRDLPAADREALDGHLKLCSECRKRADEYALLRSRLLGDRASEPLPRFWERLETRIQDHRPATAGAGLIRLWTRAIPVSLSLLAGFLVATLFLFPTSSLAPASAEMNGSEALIANGSQGLLLTGGNPIADTAPIIEESRRDVRTLRVLFASDEQSAGKR